MIEFFDEPETDLMGFCDSLLGFERPVAKVMADDEAPQLARGGENNERLSAGSR